MNLNYQKARDLMVKNQLRPNKIKDKWILNIFKETPKEDFLIDKKKVSPYSDLDINVSHNRGYLKNLHIAQLINNAEITKNHKILHLGALTGYVTVLLSNLCAQKSGSNVESFFFHKTAVLILSISFIAG